MPELRLVVLALQDRLAYGPTFEAALTSLFGGGSSSLSVAEAPQTSPEAAGVAGTAAAPKPAQDMNALIREAGKDFDEYQKLTAAGKLGEAGQKLDELKRTLDHMTALHK
jgi:hypothetical protein